MILGDKSVDKIVFKIFAKPFTIEGDVAKMKVSRRELIDDERTRS